MSVEPDRDTPHSAEAEATSGAYSGGVGGSPPPFGWYYFGPEPAWPQTGAAASPGGAHAMGLGDGGPTAGHHAAAGGAAPPYGQARVDHADLKEAFDRLSRGDLSADTIGKLLGMDDRDFWTGAVLGAAAALLATNLPTIMSMLSGVARPKAGAEQDSDQNDAKRKRDANVSDMNEERK